MTNHEIIQMLGGIEAVDTHIRELAETIAAERNMTVDELLNRVCYADMYGETTFAVAYRNAYLDGVRKGMEDTAKSIASRSAKE